MVILGTSLAFLIRWINGHGNDMVGLLSMCGTIASVCSMYVFGTKEHVNGIIDAVAIVAGGTGKALGAGVGSALVALGDKVSETETSQAIVAFVANGALATVATGAVTTLAIGGGSAAAVGGAGLGGAFFAAIAAVATSPFGILCVLTLVLLGTYSSISDSVTAAVYSDSPGSKIAWGEDESHNRGGRRKRRLRR